MDARQRQSCSSGPTVSALLILGGGAFVMNPAPALAAMALQGAAPMPLSIDMDRIGSDGSPGGMQWLAERASRAGATMTIASAPRAGTRGSDARIELAPVRLGPFARPTESFAVSAGLKFKF